MSSSVRSRADLCPGVLRPWPAADGPLVRIRLCGGLLTRGQLVGLARLAQEYGDGSLHLTRRANVQVRAVHDGSGFADALESIGLLPSRSHELVRNIVVSPHTGSLGGVGDVRPLAEELDRLLCAEPVFAGLPGRFLFTFDDRGDLAALEADLGVLAHDGSHGRLVIGARLGDLVTLSEAPQRLADLARRFLALRGAGPTAAWHVTELESGLGSADDPYPVAGPGPQLDVPGGVLDTAFVADLPHHDSVVVTPWHGLVLR